MSGKILKSLFAFAVVLLISLINSPWVAFAGECGTTASGGGC
jgi:hypothetical protein